jgi:hypothetical protein
MKFILQPDPHPARENCIAAIRAAEDGMVVEIKEPTRNGDQNAKFHALCTDIAKSGVEWMGKPRKADEWKVLLVSGHAVATKQGAEMVPGLEGEYVNIRESTARMSKSRASSLIEYTLAWMAMNGVMDRIARERAEQSGNVYEGEVVRGRLEHAVAE